MPEPMKMSTPIAVFSSINIVLGVVSISIQVLHIIIFFNTQPYVTN